jgi:hypothetical protein
VQAAVCRQPFATPLEIVFGLISADPAFSPESAPAGMQQKFIAPGRSVPLAGSLAHTLSSYLDAYFCIDR